MNYLEYRFTTLLLWRIQADFPTQPVTLIKAHSKRASNAVSVVLPLSWVKNCVFMPKNTHTDISAMNAARDTG